MGPSDHPGGKALTTSNQIWWPARGLSEISPWQFPQNPSPRSGKVNQVTPHIYAEGILGMNEITIKDPYTKRCMMPYTNHLTIGFTFALRCQLAPPKKKGPAQTAVGKGCENKLYISYSCVKRHYLICVKKTISFTVSFVLKLFGSVWCTVKVFWCQRRIGVTFIWSNDVERFLAQMTFGATGFSGWRAGRC